MNKNCTYFNLTILQNKILWLNLIMKKILNLKKKVTIWVKLI